MDLKLKHPRYTIELQSDDGGIETHEITLIMPDQLRGELEAARQGIPDKEKAPMNNMAVWIWCAAKRLRLTEADCRTFRSDVLIGLEPIDETEADTVDPTPAPSASDSS